MKWKLILNTTQSEMSKQYELYDLESDPGETRNIYSSCDRTAADLAEKLELYIKKARMVTL
jgi:hypothetical protein